MRVLSTPVKKGLRRLERWAIEHAMLTAEASLATVGVARPSALLLLGHMRSGSTLLLHLLLTNPALAAVGERGAVYASRADLARLALTTRMARHAPLRPLRYVADQVNHSYLTPDPRLLQDRRVRVLFLLRRPAPSIASILELYRVHYAQPWSVARAVEYYVERLGFLQRQGEGLPGENSAALVTYETLMESPHETLQALRGFLKLRQGFSQTYRTHPFTGTHGDPGPKIRTGRIVRPQPPASLHVEAAELDRAIKAYERCHRALARFALLPEATDPLLLRAKVNARFGESHSTCRPQGYCRAYRRSLQRELNRRVRLSRQRLIFVHYNEVSTVANSSTTHVERSPSRAERQASKSAQPIL